MSGCEPCLSRVVIALNDMSGCEPCLSRVVIALNDMSGCEPCLSRVVIALNDVNGCENKPGYNVARFNRHSTISKAFLQTKVHYNSHGPIDGNGVCVI